MHKTTRIKLTDLNPHLMCVLCGGYLVDATTIIECLHSFCRSCITRYLESSKFCPICDVMVHKTRPLLNTRADRSLQNLVYKLVPGLFKGEMRRRREFYSANPEAGTSATSVNAMEERGEIDEDRSLRPEEEMISLCLQHSDRLPPFKNGVSLVETANASTSSDRRYLLCPNEVTVEHLKKFIRVKFDLAPNYMIEVFYSDESLKDDYTLLDVAYIYGWRRVEPLRLYYIVYDKADAKISIPKSTSEHPITCSSENSVASKSTTCSTQPSKEAEIVASKQSAIDSETDAARSIDTEDQIESEKNVTLECQETGSTDSGVVECDTTEDMEGDEDVPLSVVKQKLRSTPAAEGQTKAQFLSHNSAALVAESQREGEPQGCGSRNIPSGDVTASVSQTNGDEKSRDEVITNQSTAGVTKEHACPSNVKDHNDNENNVPENPDNNVNNTPKSDPVSDCGDKTTDGLFFTPLLAEDSSPKASRVEHKSIIDSHKKQKGRNSGVSALCKNMNGTNSNKSSKSVKNTSSNPPKQKRKRKPKDTQATGLQCIGVKQSNGVQQNVAVTTMMHTSSVSSPVTTSAKLNGASPQRQYGLIDKFVTSGSVKSTTPSRTTLPSNETERSNAVAKQKTSIVSTAKRCNKSQEKLPMHSNGTVKASTKMKLKATIANTVAGNKNGIQDANPMSRKINVPKVKSVLKPKTDVPVQSNGISGIAVHCGGSSVLPVLCSGSSVLPVRSNSTSSFPVHTNGLSSALPVNCKGNSVNTNATSVYSTVNSQDQRIFHAPGTWGVASSAPSSVGNLGFANGGIQTTGIQTTPHSPLVGINTLNIQRDMPVRIETGIDLHKYLLDATMPRDGFFPSKAKSSSRGNKEVCAVSTAAQCLPVPNGQTAVSMNGKTAIAPQNKSATVVQSTGNKSFTTKTGPPRKKIKVNGEMNRRNSLRYPTLYRSLTSPSTQHMPVLTSGMAAHLVNAASGQRSTPTGKPDGPSLLSKKTK